MATDNPAVGASGFLVLVCYMGEDIPCGLFGDNADAVEFAKTIPWSLEGVVAPNEQPHDEWSASFMTVVEFRKGKRVNTVWLRDFEAECVLSPSQRHLISGGKRIEREARAERERERTLFNEEG